MRSKESASRKRSTKTTTSRAQLSSNGSIRAKSGKNPTLEYSSSGSEVLRTHLLTDNDLEVNQRDCLAVIRVVSTTRTRCRLQLKQYGNSNWHTYEFVLFERIGEFCTNVTTTSSNRSIPAWKLMWHKAAEAILAVRRGHMEHRRRAIAEKVLDEMRAQQ